MLGRMEMAEFVRKIEAVDLPKIADHRYPRLKRNIEAYQKLD